MDRLYVISPFIFYALLLIPTGINPITLSTFKEKDTLENIRAKGKLFGNDKYLSFSQQVNDFKNITNTQHKYSKGLAKPFCPHFLIDDVGTYRIGNVFIGNSIQYVYDFSCISKKYKNIFENESKQEIKCFSAKIGASLQEILTLLTGKNYQIIYSNEHIQEHNNADFNFARTFKRIEKLLTFSLV